MAKDSEQSFSGPEAEGSPAADGMGSSDEEGTAAGAEGEGAPRPARYKIYDRIADNVSLQTMNIIVIVVSLL